MLDIRYSWFVLVEDTCARTIMKYRIVVTEYRCSHYMQLNTMSYLQCIQSIYDTHSMFVWKYSI